jgi:hypothetical protein
LITYDVITYIYAAGAILFTLGGILVLFDVKFAAQVSSQNAYLDGILALTVGNLVWRLICEGWMVLFAIHQRLAEQAPRYELAKKQ